MTLLVGSIFHMTRKIVSEMTYNVSMGTLNPTIPYSLLLLYYVSWQINSLSLIIIPYKALEEPQHDGNDAEALLFVL